MMQYKLYLLKSICLLIVMFSVFNSQFAQLPCENEATYYSDISNDDCGADLKTELHNLINDHTRVSYQNQVFGLFTITDIDNDMINIIDMYTEEPFFPIDDECSPPNNPANPTEEGICYQREHSFPVSYWGGGVSPSDTMFSDLFHLYPVDGYINSAVRSDLPYGEVDINATLDLNPDALYGTANGSLRGISANEIPDYADPLNDNLNGLVFEPIDEYKGDFARTYFYMATRYESRIADWKNIDSKGQFILDGNPFPAFEPGYLEMLLRWHELDPVSDKERNRNDAVCLIQGNRNPFIDNPNYVGRIWGDFAGDSGGNNGDDSPVMFQIEANQSISDGCIIEQTNVINGGNFSISESSGCGAVKAELTGVDFNAQVEVDLIELADEVVDIIVEGDDLDPEDFLDFTFGATAYIANVCGAINSYLVTLTDAFTLEFEIVGSVNYKDIIQVFSPVETTLELPIHVSATLVAAQSLCDPNDNEAKAEARVTGSFGSKNINVGGEVVQNGPLVDVDYLDETEIITVNIEPGLNTFEFQFSGELNVKSSVIAASPILACASNAGAISGNTITVGLFTGPDGGPIPDGMSINGLLTGADYVNPELGGLCTNIPFPQISTTDASCGEANGGASLTVDGIDTLIVEWSNGVMGNTVTGLNPGENFVIVKDSFDCSKLFPFFILDPTIPLINLPEDTLIDDGEIIVLDATDPNNPNLTYLWSTGETTPTILVDTIGIFGVTVTNTLLNCDFVFETQVVSANELLISQGDIIVSSGLFYDDGGPDNNYEDDNSYVISICPENEGEFIVLDFTEVEVIKDSDQDELSVFDGLGSTCVLNSDITEPTTFTASASSEGCLTVRFRATSQDDKTGDGWKAIISTTTSPPAGCFNAIYSCDFVFTDSGGPDGNYQPDEFQVYTICPENPDTEFAILDFIEVSANNFDRISVYDGSGIQCLLEPNLKQPQTFTASSISGGCLTVVFDSDSGSTSRGWVANISCTTMNPNPPLYCACELNQQPSNTCDEAPLINNLEAFCGQTSILYTANSTESLADEFSECGVIHNNSFLRFIADSTVVVINYQTAGGIADLCSGFQLAAYSVTGPCSSESSVWNQLNCENFSDGLESEGMFMVSDLIPGNEYYLMIDGSFGSECYYTLQAMEGFETCPLDISFEEIDCQPDGSYSVTIPFVGNGDGTNYVAYEFSNFFEEIDTVTFTDDGMTDSFIIGPYPAGRDYNIVIEGGTGFLSCDLNVTGSSNCPIDCGLLNVDFEYICDSNDDLFLRGQITGGTLPISFISDFYSDVLFLDDETEFLVGPVDSFFNGIEYDFFITDINSCSLTDIISFQDPMIPIDASCLSLFCTDGIQNGNEEGIDCGGDCPVSCFDPSTVDCNTFNLNFKDEAIFWPNNSMLESMVYPDITFDIVIEDPTNIFVDSEEADEGIQIGIDPNTVSDSIIIRYTFSETMNFAQFKIKDLDYKNLVGSSRLQESVTVFGILNAASQEQVIPVIQNFDGSVLINGNNAQGASNAIEGEEESVLVTFHNCVDQIVIVYGTGDNPPVVDPTYSKIQIGTELGFRVDSCFPNDCDLTCKALARLDFSTYDIDWVFNEFEGEYDLVNQSFDISISDPSSIFRNSLEADKGIGVRMNPNDVSESLITQYNFETVSDYTVFDIEDIEYKPEDMQEEVVIVEGMFEGNIVLPVLYSLNGSVNVDGNTATGTSGIDDFDESILVIFEEPIEGFTIVQTSVDNNDITDPDFSKIYIGRKYGVYTSDCGCQDTLALHNLILDAPLYRANESISSNSLLQNNAGVTFQAGNTILLNQGFEVVQSSTFYARIEGCQ